MAWQKEKEEKKRGGNNRRVAFDDDEFYVVGQILADSIYPPSYIYIYIGRLSEVGGEERKWNAVRFAVEGIN